MAIVRTSLQFEELYKKLNPEQKEAVDTIEGPVMVVAGPGTGKTHVLTLRIAKILLETDIEPENILALTFTEGAAYEMEKRLAEMMGNAGYRVSVFTFHGFCNHVISQYPDEFPDIIGSLPIGKVDQVKLAQEIIKRGDFKLLKPFGNPLYYIPKLLKLISDLKREGIGENEFEKMVEAQAQRLERAGTLFYEKGAHEGQMKKRYRDLQKQIEKNREVVEFYMRYEEALQEHRYYDYEDMILKVVQTLSRNQDLLVSLQEYYQYILADEHQDVNNAQNKVLELLTNYSDSPNLFIVGDEKQAIFRFQGASVENFRYFERKYPNGNVIQLKHSYRSPQTLLDAAGSLMGQARNSLISQVQGEGSKIQIYSFSREDVEVFFLQQELKKKIESGISPNSIAVLYRENKDSFLVGRALEHARIPFVVETDEDILQDEDIQKFLMLLKAVGDFGNEDLLMRILHIDFLNVEPLDLYMLSQFARIHRLGLYHALRSAETIPGVSLEMKERFSKLYRLLSSWNTLSYTLSCVDLFDVVARESGFLAHLTTLSNSWEKLQKVRHFFHAVRALLATNKRYLLSDFLSYLPILEEQGILWERPAQSFLREGVRLMTVHKAKGREFEYVYIINVVDQKWGGRRIPQTFLLPEETQLVLPTSPQGQQEEERKLLYVALTRAKREAVVTFSRENSEGKAQFPSRFLEEIHPELREMRDGNEYEDDFSKHQETFFLQIFPKGPSVQEQDFLRKLFSEQGFSVTALNNYVECPWKYFYMSLLKLPKAPTKFQRYGTAVHSALRDFFEFYKRTGESQKEVLLSRFEAHLQRAVLLPDEFEEIRQKGINSLSGYYDVYHQSFERNILNEVRIQGAMLGTIKLTGQIDKIEILQDGMSVNVVDYKTRKPLTRNEIEGKTKNSRGEYKRQLVFYKLLVERYWQGKYHMVSGILDFVEPDGKGLYRKERFEIGDQEVSQLEEMIRQVVSEIQNFAFWNKTCGKRDCEFCALGIALQREKFPGTIKQAR